VTAWDEKTRVRVGDVTLALPTAVRQKPGTPIDSAFSEFSGSGVTVLVDQGPFADRLDRHVGRAGYEEKVGEVAGSAARIVSFRRPEERAYVVAAHLPAPHHVTVVVQADESVPDHVPREIVESVRPVGAPAEERSSNGQGTS
jgi:hypothetical protein